MLIPPVTDGSKGQSARKIGTLRPAMEASADCFRAVKSGKARRGDQASGSRPGAVARSRRRSRRPRGVEADDRAAANWPSRAGVAYFL